METGILFSQIFFNGKDIEIAYEVNANCVTHHSDWIGVYQEDFKSTDDYVTYLYPERIVEFENIKYKKDMQRTSDSKYFTYNKNNLMCFIKKNMFFRLEGGEENGYFEGLLCGRWHICCWILQ